MTLLTPPPPHSLPAKINFESPQIQRPTVAEVEWHMPSAHPMVTYATVFVHYSYLFSRTTTTRIDDVFNACHSMV